MTFGDYSAPLQNKAAVLPHGRNNLMAISDNATYVERERTRARLSEMLQQSAAASDPLNRAYYEGSIAGFDSVSALQNPYANGPLRYKWLDGFTYGKRLKIPGSS